MKLSYSTWGMQTTPIDEAVRHCAALGYDGLELTIIPGWPTDAATMRVNERRRIRQLYDDAGLELCGISGNVGLLQGDPSAEEADAARFRTYLDFAAELQQPGERLIVTTVSGGAPATGSRASTSSSRPPAGWQRTQTNVVSWLGSSRMPVMRCALRTMPSG
jgi:sugar phosphate isomerase/epimerase